MKPFALSKIFLLSCCVLGFFFVSKQLVQAKEAFSLSVNPPISYLSVKPGAGISQRLNLRNDGQYSLKVTPQYVDFTADGKTGQAVLGQTSDFPYLTIEGDSEKWGQSFYLKPGEEKSVALVVAVPSNFPQAEQHLSVLFQAEQLLGEQNTQTDISAIVASNIVLAISADQENHADLKITDFHLPRFIDSFWPLEFSLLVKNQGSNAGVVSGNLSVSHWPDGQILAYQLYPDMVLAQSSRQVRGMTTEKLEALKELEKEAEAKQAIGQNTQGQKEEFVRKNLQERFRLPGPFLLGSYEVEVQVGEEIQKETVVALPFSILVLAVLSAILYTGIKWFFRRFSRPVSQKKAEHKKMTEEVE